MASSSTAIIKSGGTLSGVTQVGTGQQIAEVAKLSLPNNGIVDSFTISNLDYTDIVDRPLNQPNSIHGSSIFGLFIQPGIYLGGGANFVRMLRDGRYIATANGDFIKPSAFDICEMIVGTETTNISVTLNGKRVSTQ